MPSRYQRNRPTKTKHKMPTVALDDRLPSDVVGSKAWLICKPHPPSTPIYQRNPSERQISTKERVQNRNTINKIIAHIEKYGWQMIDGGEMNECWINTRTYPNKLFKPGMIYDREMEKRILFPISDSDNDKRGIAFHFERGANGIYEVESNRWYTVETDTRRGRRASRKNIAAAQRQEKFGMQSATKHPYESNMSTIEMPGFNMPAPSVPKKQNRLSLEISEKE